jgi:type III restriction enzyme
LPKDNSNTCSAIRWFPADEDLRKEGYEKLLPPFVPELREK